MDSAVGWIGRQSQRIRRREDNDSAVGSDGVHVKAWDTRRQSEAVYAVRNSVALKLD